MKCPGCKAEIPDNSVFCLTCGRPIKEEGLEPIAPPSGSKTEERSILLMAFSFMVLFFGIFLLIPAFFLGSWIFASICFVLIGMGVVLLVARFLLLRKYSKKIEHFREEASEKVRCKYCGSLNSPKDEKCIGCGAPMT